MKKEIINELKQNFLDEIITRGKKYFERGNVQQIYKSGNTYMSRVKSDNSNAEYTVAISIEDKDMICDCPCFGNCKHEYAMLLKIENDEDNIIEILPEVEYKEMNIKDVIQKLNEQQLRDYLNLLYDINEIDEHTFKRFFKKYEPQQEGEYFYNTLFNAIKMKQNPCIILEEFMDEAKDSLEQAKYEYSFMILETIISVFIDNKTDNKFSLKAIDNLLPIVGMQLRIIKRKGSDTLKKKFEEFIKKIEVNDYYNDIYLEDIIITLKNIN